MKGRKIKTGYLFGKNVGMPRANTIEFEADTERKFDWVYVVDNMGYMKYDKSENIEEKMTNIIPYDGMYEVNGKQKKIKIIGTMQDNVFENFERLITVEDGVIHYGVHPSGIMKL